jgi:hypothetical protein
MTDAKMPENAKKFHCEICDFVCLKLSNYEKHLATDKHSILTNTDKKMPKNAEHKFRCECGKSYKHRQSLFTHKNKGCEKTKENQIISHDGEKVDYKEMLYGVIKQNKELQQTISELIPKIGNNNNNNIKQKFNINVFLNEDCKDALTMEQFINKIEVSLSNLMLTKNKGIEEGISNIFIENMNKLSLYERPIHCTDVKRETMYIKSEDTNGGLPKWEKDENKTKIKGAISKVTHLQRKNMNKWIEEHPNWANEPDLQDEYLRLIKKCTDDIDENKVIKKLCDVIKEQEAL